MNRKSLQRRFLLIGAVPALVLFGALTIWTDWNLIVTWMLAWTPGVFLLYGYDKLQAKRNGIRVPESSLLALAAAGGFAGAIAGMLVFHHKTTKTVFWAVSIGAGLFFAVLLIVV